MGAAKRDNDVFLCSFNSNLEIFSEIFSDLLSLHVQENGESAADVPLDKVCGEALVIDLGEVEPSHPITIEDIDKNDRLGIREGDIITRLNNQEIDSPATFAKVVEGLTPGRSVPVLIVRGQAPTFLALRVPAE
jgi:hypothetical protein